MFSLGICIVEFELFVNHICLFVTILYCTSYEHHHRLIDFIENSAICLLNIGFIVSLDYIFQCAVFIEAMAFSAHSKCTVKFKIIVLFNNWTACTAEYRIWRNRYPEACAGATTVPCCFVQKNLCYLEIQLYQSIFVSQLSPLRCTLHLFYIDYNKHLFLWNLFVSISLILYIWTCLKHLHLFSGEMFAH